MAENKIVVDHLKFEYTGIFDINNFFRMHDAWCFERRYEKRMERNDQLETDNGKFIEIEYMHWKKASDYIRQWFRPRVFMFDLKEVEALGTDGKPKKLMQGKVLIYIDAFIEQDYEHRWDGHPILIFIRTMFNKYFFRAWSERFERVMARDMHQLYDTYERFFNTYRLYRPIAQHPSMIQK